MKVSIKEIAGIALLTASFASIAHAQTYPNKFQPDLKPESINLQENIYQAPVYEKPQFDLPPVNPPAAEEEQLAEPEPDVCENRLIASKSDLYFDGRNRHGHVKLTGCVEEISALDEGPNGTQGAPKDPSRRVGDAKCVLHFTLGNGRQVRVMSDSDSVCNMLTIAKTTNPEVEIDGYISYTAELTNIVRRGDEILPAARVQMGVNKVTLR